MMRLDLGPTPVSHPTHAGCSLPSSKVVTGDASWPLTSIWNWG